MNRNKETKFEGLMPLVMSKLGSIGGGVGPSVNMNSSNGQQPLETTDFLSAYDKKNDKPIDLYLTFTAQEPNSTVQFNLNKYNTSNRGELDLEYSLDNGKTWNIYTIDYTDNIMGDDYGIEIVLSNVGDSVKFRGNNNTFYYNGKVWHNHYYFLMTGTIEASGDITSLTNNVGGDYNLPVKCYSWMFSQCTSLTTAPNLPATTLANNCYNSMFYGCSNLNNITALFTDGTTDIYSSEWVYGVSETGTFYVSPNIDQKWINDAENRNTSAIPEGWSINVYNQ